MKRDAHKNFLVVKFQNTGNEYNLKSSQGFKDRERKEEENKCGEKEKEKQNTYTYRSHTIYE